MKKFYALLFAAAVGVCASNAATVPLSGAGTQANPYQITSAADWNSLGAYIASEGDTLDGKYVKIMNNIDFTGVTVTPLGSYTNATNHLGFGGILMGNNCTISGINFEPSTTYQGMIGYLRYGGEVNDLTLEGTISATANYCGAFFGRLNGKVTNCTNKVTVTSTNGYLGGFAGYADVAAVFVNCNNYGAVTTPKGYLGGFAGMGQKGISFTGCTNYGTITNSGANASPKYTGGFVGYGYATSYVNCNNYGEVVAQNGAYAGGLAGYVMGTGNLVFTNCNNYAPVTGNSLVGGLVGGTLDGASAAKCAIIADNCHNYAAITSTLRAKSGTGGLFGGLSTGSIITNCHNEGTVTSAASAYAGGIWGFHCPTTKDSTEIIVENCYNTGDVTNGGNYAGGLGSIPRFTHMTNCYNTGNLTAAICAGGLGSAMGDDIIIDKCWNSGNCTTTSKAGAGGLLAIANYRVYVSNSFNTGDVYAASNNAGGLLGTGRAKFTNCYNRGNVSAGIHTAGGLIGQGSNNTGNTVNHGATMINCYNAGMVSAPNDSLVGNIMGNTSYWVTEKGCSLTDCYYVTDYYGKEYDRDTLGATGVTVKELAAKTSMPGDWTYGDAYTYPMIKDMENDCAQAFAVAVVLADGDTYDNVTTSFTLGEQDAAEWTSSTDSILITDYAFIGGPIDKMSQAVVMTASAADGKFQAPWHLTINAEKAATGIEENELSDRVLTSTMYYDITGAEVTTPAAGNLYIRLNKYNDGTQSASKIRF